MISKDKDKFECKICNVFYNTKLDATKHLIDLHLTEEQKFRVCQICVEVFGNDIGLEQHHELVHGKIKRHFYKCAINMDCSFPPTTSLIR